MAINRLQLSDLVGIPQINLAPLGRIGEAYSEQQQRKELQDAISQSGGDPNRMAEALVRLGHTGEAAALLNAATHRGQLSLGERKLQYEQQSEREKAARERRAIDQFLGGGQQSELTPSQSQLSLNSDRISRELQDPQTRDLLSRMTYAEVGSQGPEAQRAFMESVRNRALARNETIAQTLSNREYFPQTTFARAASAPRGLYDPIINEVVSGSNAAGYATGNASGNVGFAGGPQTATYGGERFGVEGPDRGWAANVAGVAPATPLAPQQNIQVAQEGPPRGLVSEQPTSQAVRNAKIQQIIRAMPDLPQGAREVAKFQLQQLQAEQKAEESVPLAGARAEETTRRTEGVKAEIASRSEANQAGTQLSRLAQVRALANKIDTNKTFNARMSVAALSKAFGFSEDTLGPLGLNPGELANAQAFNALVNELVLGKTPSGSLGAQISNTDRDFLAATVPQLTDDPKAIKLKLDLAERMARRTIEKQSEYRQFKQDNPGKSYFDFEDQWLKKIDRESAFGDLKREAESLVNPSQPKELPKTNKTNKGVIWSIE